MTTSASLQFSLCWAALLAGDAVGGDRLPEAVDRYVLFGFGPFAGRQENGSWQSIKEFASGTQIRAVEVPVVWGAPRTHLIEMTKGTGKIMLAGLGEGGEGYQVETVGFNERATKIDEAGKYPEARAIAPEGEPRLKVDGPALELAEKLSAKGFPSRVSTDAGRFLCNEMLYELLRIQRENPKVAGVYFIHVPVLGSEIKSGGEKKFVNHEYCAAFGRALLGALRELHPLVETSPASVQ